MNVIYYNVSGEVMEILQFLLSFFLNNFKGGSLSPIFNLLKENSFDIKKLVQNLNPEVLAPIIKSFMELNKNEKSPTEFVGQGEGLKPIATIADKDIVYTLNRYFYSV